MSPGDLDRFHAVVADGHLAGLRAAGWTGPAALVRRGMAASMAAKHTWIAPALLRAAVDGRTHVNGRPLAATAAAWAPTVLFLLARADEARTLAADPTLRSTLAPS